MSSVTPINRYQVKNMTRAVSAMLLLVLGEAPPEGWFEAQILEVSRLNADADVLEEGKMRGFGERRVYVTTESRPFRKP